MVDGRPEGTIPAGPRHGPDACSCERAAIERHFDRHAPDRRDRPAHATTRLIERGLIARGTAGRTVLELGAGRGLLLAELLRSGAARATGVDLSTVSLDVARAHLEAAGVVDRADLVVGDGATAHLERHDWVVLDRVVCCYPDADALLANAVAAAGRLVAVSMPASSGWRGTAARAALGLERAWLRFRGDAFGVYVHPFERIAGILRSSGFRQTEDRRHGFWQVAVFERTGEPQAA